MAFSPPSWTKDFEKLVESATHLFVTDKSRNRQNIMEIAEGFLSNWINSKETVNYQRIRIPHLKDQGLGFPSYPQLCWYFLLEYDPQKALTLAADWYAAGLDFPDDILMSFHHYLGPGAVPVLLSAAATDAISFDLHGYFYNPRRHAIDLLAVHFTPADYGPLFWNLIGHKSKPVREYIARILAENDPEAEAKAIGLLQHKKSEIRQSAAIILGLTASPAARKAIGLALDKEPNDNARDILLETAADSLPEQADEAWIGQMIDAAAARGKLDKTLPYTDQESDLPDLFYTSGNKLDNRSLRFLFYRIERSRKMSPDIEARYLLAVIDKARSTPFASAMLKILVERNERPEDKHLLLLAGILGDEATADRIRQLIDTWAMADRNKMAEYGLGALAMQGSDKALNWVQNFSRKYAKKKAAVGAAASAALEAAAIELGITTYELGDRIVPDFGFDGLFRHFEAGGESYRVFIDSKFKLAFFDDSNKKLKSLPASTTEDLKQVFKAVTKEIRDTVKSQSPRLEYYLIIQRKWTFAQWHMFFLQNPVMFIYATRMLWGVYKDGMETPDTTFFCDEDTTLLDLQEEEISAQPGWNIGIVHPSQLDPATLKAWQEKFFDRNIAPVFPQLDRKQVNLEGLDLSKTIIRTFDGRRTQTGSIRSTLDKLGWQAGPIGDGGMIGTYHLHHDAKKLEAIIEIEGVGAGFGWTGDEKTGRLYFARRDNPRKKWWHYPNDEADPLLIPLKDIPILFLLETLAAIDTIKPASAS